MLGHEPPEPKLWKACIAALLVALPAAWLSHEIIPSSPLWLWLTGGTVLALACGYNMHRKARYDGSAHWRMNFTHIDRKTYVPRNVRIGKD